MKLIRIEIQNFRTINRIKFNPSDYTLLVGANNAGKTTIIDALRIFYEHEGYKYVDERDKPYNVNNEKEIESWIELGFSITEEEEKLLPKTYKHYKREIILRKWFAHVDRGIKPRKYGAGLN
ncbi:AAA family ATPase [Legionella sp. WA2022007384]